MKQLLLLINLLIVLPVCGQNSLSIKSNEYYNKALQEDNLNKKLNLLNQSLENDKSHINALIARGITLKALGKYKEAEEDYINAKAIDPTNQTVYYNYGNLMLAQNKRMSAVALYKKAPNLVDAYRNMGVAYLALDSVDLAYKYMSIAVQQDSNNFEVLDNLAKIQFLYEDYKTASYLLEKSGKINDKYIETHLLKIELYSKTNQKENALKEYKKISNEKLSMGEIVTTGYYLYNLGLLNESLELNKRGLKLNENKSEVYNAIGLVYLDTGRFSDAIENFKSSIKEDENNRNPYVNIGYTLNEMGKYKDAINYYLVAIKKFDKLSSIYNNIGYSYLMDNQKENAKYYIEEAIEIDTNNSYAYKNLALFYKSTDSNKACELIEKAIEIDKEQMYLTEYRNLKKSLCK